MNPDTWWEPYVLWEHYDLYTPDWTGFGPKSWPPKFAVKWITGPTTISNFTAYMDTAPQSHKIMQFTEIPAMSFLDCKPTIEQTDTKVTIARNSGQVLAFDLIEEPEMQTDAWTAHFDHKPQDYDGVYEAENGTYLPVVVDEFLNLTAKVR
jgi:hypothetical protein